MVTPFKRASFGIFSCTSKKRYPPEAYAGKDTRRGYVLCKHTKTNFCAFPQGRTSGPSGGPLSFADKRKRGKKITQGERAKGEFPPRGKPLRSGLKTCPRHVLFTPRPFPLKKPLSRLVKNRRCPAVRCAPRLPVTGAVRLVGIHVYTHRRCVEERFFSPSVSPNGEPPPSTREAFGCRFVPRNLYTGRNPHGLGSRQSSAPPCAFRLTVFSAQGSP